MMPRFRFRFATLLKHRRQLELQAKRDLAVHLRTKMILEGQLRNMQQSISAAKQDMAEGLVGKVDVDALRRIGTHGSHVQLRGQQIVLKLAQVERDVHQSRSKLLDTTRQRKALELLRQRQFEEWKQEQARRETNELDDRATGAFVRRLMKGWRDMKSILLALGVLVAVNLLAVGAGVGWL